MIKFLVMDVDGTLTDGKIYMGVDGEVMKAFDIKDGYAMHTLLKEHGIILVIITARKSPMVEHRCKELGVTEIHQGIMNKLDCLKSILEKYSSADQKYDLSNVAYIGDDLLDLRCMKLIKEAGGIAGCPSNAVKEVVEACDYVAPHKGGEGAVRDFSEYLMKTDCSSIITPSLEKRCIEAADFLTHLGGDSLSLGRHVVNEDFYYNVIEYETTSENEKPFESHRKYVDAQLLLEGEEILQVTDINRLQDGTNYDEDSDIVLYKATTMAASTLLRPGTVLILYPRDAHRSLSLTGRNGTVKKIVGKIKIG